MHKRNRNIIATLLLIFGILGCYKEHMALFRHGESTPEKIYPYPIAAFPVQDQAALKKGIPIENEAELIRIIQDYLS